jgi:glycosyltransferase involved in cell wall biosynthesis
MNEPSGGERGSVSEPVKVMFVSSHARLGGEENYLARLLEELGPEWVAGVVALEDAPFVERLRSLGAPTVVIPTSARAPGMLRSALRLRRALGRAKPQVVHANGVKAAVVCAVATFGSRFPLIWLKHDFSWDGRLARAVASRCDQVVGVSEAVTETFRGGTRRKVHVVHNGLPPLEVDRGRGRRTLESLVGVPGAEIVSLVGRIDPTKGHGELLAVLPDLRARRPRLHVAFIGAEHFPHLEFAAELKQGLAARGLEEAVTFVGFREDAIDLIAGSDVVVIPSTIDDRGLGREGFPYVGLEAMAVGTPVVGYEHGGLPELLGECGLLVPPGDRAALRHAILDVLEDDAERERLVTCGRSRMQERFSLAGMVEAMKARYREAADERP